MVIAIGATTMRYTTVIKQMDTLFSGQVIVVDKYAIVLQALPVGGDMLPQDSTVQEIISTQGVSSATPVLFVTSLGSHTTIPTLPTNFSLGIPVKDWQSVLGPIPLRKNGHFPTDDSSNEIVVGPSLADQFNWTVGTVISVNGYSLNVTGILDTQMALLNRSIIMPLALAQTVYNYPGSVNIVAVKPVQNIPEQNLTAALNQKIENINALTETERNDVIQPVLQQVETWSIGIEAVIFVISLILVATVALMSVSERRRDFATLDAIGAPTNYVFKLVIAETFLIGVIGGVLGLAFGSLTAIVLASLYTNIPITLFFPSILQIMPPVYMAEMFSANVILCCLGGVIPALSAMKMRVAEVLRADY
jgi:ABC-type lipoprotein release transport system permease subunit